MKFVKFSFFYDSVNNAIVMQICNFEKNKKTVKYYNDCED